MKVWTDARLRQDRQRATADFVRERLGEPLDVYLGDFDDAQDAVEELLEGTLDLPLLLPAHPADELSASRRCRCRGAPPSPAHAGCGRTRSACRGSPARARR